MRDFNLLSTIQGHLRTTKATTTTKKKKTKKKKKKHEKKEGVERERSRRKERRGRQIEFNAFNRFSCRLMTGVMHQTTCSTILSITDHYTKWQLARDI